MLRSIGI